MCKRLTGCELMVMRCIWNCEREVRVAEIVQQLNAQGVDYKRTTVATYLIHLKEKGYIDVSREVKNVFYYLPLVSFDEYRRAMIRECLDTWYQGDREALLADLE